MLSSSRIETVTARQWVGPLIRPAMSNTVDTSARVRLTNRFVELNGIPAVPVSGEIHYSRVPRSQWEERLRLMKAGGITVVATYVIWIHHEEHRGRPSFEDNLDVAAFVDLCDHVGLDVVLRIGPWCHGEVRNGGFPDWVQESGTTLRTNDPSYLELVRTWFSHLGAQLATRCGAESPIIGIQLENELYDQPEHIRTLKGLARSVGLTAPVWTATAWGGAQLPEGQVLPLYGGYGDGFWVDADAGWDPTFRAHYFFSSTWDDPGIGADLREDALDQLGGDSGSEALIGMMFPPATCEIGGGMATTYHRRPRPSALDIAAVAHTKIGNGSAWQGFYMFAGGINPVGQHGMQESHATGYPNDLPRFDYDFAAPLSANGQLAESFAALRSQHAFLAAFGSTLAPMPSALPDRLPTGVEDTETLRWALRSDGDSGVVFVGWHQPHVPLPVARAVQFRVVLEDRVVEFPADPVDIPAGTLARWPVRFSLGETRVEWATASLLTLLEAPSQRPTLVLQAEPGIAVDIAIAGNAVLSLTTANTSALLERRDGHWRLDLRGEAAVPLTVDDGSADILVLSPEHAKDAWVLTTARGRELLLSDDPTWVSDGGLLEVRSDGTPGVNRYVPQSREFLAVTLRSQTERLPSSTALPVTLLSQALPPPAHYGMFEGRQSAPLEQTELGATYRLDLPDPAGRLGDSGVLLTLDWEGDIARLSAGGTVILDRFWDGSLWTIALDELALDAELTLEIIPLSPESLIHLPVDAEQRRRRTADSLGALLSATLTETTVWREVLEESDRTSHGESAAPHTSLSYPFRWAR